MTAELDLPQDLADALADTRWDRRRDATGYEDIPTADLHRLCRDQTGPYWHDPLEEELRRRHPELARLWHVRGLASRAEDDARADTGEPFDAMRLLELRYPVTDAVSTHYRAIRDALVQYDDAYLDGPALADRLQVEPGTVRKMSTRGVLPRPDLTVGGRPAWHWTTVYAIETNRRGPGRPATRVPNMTNGPSAPS